MSSIILSVIGVLSIIALALWLMNKTVVAITTWWATKRTIVIRENSLGKLDPATEALFQEMLSITDEDGFARYLYDQMDDESKARVDGMAKTEAEELFIYRMEQLVAFLYAAGIHNIKEYIEINKHENTVAVGMTVLSLYDTTVDHTRTVTKYRVKQHNGNGKQKNGNGNNNTNGKSKNGIKPENAKPGDRVHMTVNGGDEKVLMVCTGYDDQGKPTFKRIAK